MTLAETATALLVLATAAFILGGICFHSPDAEHLRADRDAADAHADKLSESLSEWVGYATSLEAQLVVARAENESFRSIEAVIDLVDWVDTTSADHRLREVIPFPIGAGDRVFTGERS